MATSLYKYYHGIILLQRLNMDLVLILVCRESHVGM